MGAGKAKIASAGSALMVGSNEANERVLLGVPAGDFGTVVGGTVVDDEDFYGRKSGKENRIQTAGEVVFVIVKSDDDGEKGSGSQRARCG